MSPMKLSYLFLGVFETTVWLSRRVRILFVLITYVGGLILNSIFLCLSRIHYLQHFPFFVSFASVARTDENRWFRLQNLSWKRTGRS